MEDLVDEARVTGTEQAFYGGKTTGDTHKKKPFKDNGKEKDSKSSNKKYTYYSKNHDLKDCFKVNKKKRTKQEERAGKKQLSPEEFKKKKDKESKKSNKKGDDSDSEGFGLVAITETEEALLTSVSILYYDDFLTDLGVTVYITYDRTRFEDDYTE